ncbi:histidine phosphatase family protein [Rhodopila sp.]|jgi:broad specificity phosphatase PhoE|uniref:histidine phosphatase family protein n=1 Tax=Rhodopila sp. TaxID=2480087 RepID=UPI002BA59D15|nr:histidine phosphatase family protein [Rhodopila sp.]HVZ06384.1 histidine phosphatase family protein [Rhodopila sp.]
MILLRHGQSEFNLHFGVTRRDPGIIDPRLTRLGHEQADAAAEALAAEGITRIIASPYTRALQTAHPIARLLGLPVVIEPLIRERYAYACDIGSPCSVLSREWPDHDFSHLDDVWWPDREESESSILGRAARFRESLAAREDWAETLVVSHWGFILSMTGRSVMNGQWLRCDPSQPGPESLTWQA